jgi:choline kinase
VRVFILVAGVGTRISRLAQGRPKCLLEVGGRTLISQMVDRLNRRGLKDITLVTGFKQELVRGELGGRVNYRHNPFFHVTNSIASLWFARDLLEDDTIVTNGDLFYEDQLLDALLRDPREVVMLADSSRIADADYRFRLEGERIVGYGKEIPNSQTDAEYVGMALIRRPFIGRFRDRLERLVDTQNTGMWWEDALYSFIPEGVPIYHRDVAGTFWAEVDYVEDYERILKWLSGRKPQT